MTKPETTPETAKQDLTKAKKLAKLTGLYDRYRVDIEFCSDLEGGVPTNKELIKAWVSARLKKSKRDFTKEEVEKIADETIAALPHHALEQVTETTLEHTTLYNSFKRDNVGALVLESRCIKSMFKEAGSVLREVLSTDAKALGREAKYNTMFKSRIAEELFVEGEFNRFLRADAPLFDVDGHEEKPIHVTDPRTGQKNHALKRYDFLLANHPAGPLRTSFVVRILRDKNLTEHDLLRMLEYAQDNGLGSGRSQGRGVFKVLDITQLEPTEASPLFIKRPPAKD